jgi:probable Rubsico expression protein CbbX
MSFTGSSGTGKTTVALRMGQILQRMGYCRKGHVVIATRDDLVGQYQGHTVPKTKEVVKRAMGGVLFIDEAHNLLNAESDCDYGQESINILLDVMENKKEDLVVVLAGHEDKMDRFYSLIPGMKSRIGNIMNFPDYGADEMVEIAKVMCRELEYDMEDAAIEKLRDYFWIRQTMPLFANARTVQNTIDQARMRQAIRLLEEKSSASSDGFVSEDELKLITAADIPGEEDLESDSGANVAKKEAEQAAGRLSFNPALAGGILSFEECVADGILSFEECLAERVAMMA